MHKQCLGKSGFTPSMGKKKKQSRQSLLNYLPLQNDSLNPISTPTLEKQCCLLFFFMLSHHRKYPGRKKRIHLSFLEVIFLKAFILW